jgi:hypothetical protein
METAYERPSKGRTFESASAFKVHRGGLGR